MYKKCFPLSDSSDTFLYYSWHSSTRRTARVYSRFVLTDLRPFEVLFLRARGQLHTSPPPFLALLIATTRRFSRIRTDFCCVKKFYSPLETLATREPNSMEACLPFHTIRLNSITIGTPKPDLQLESALRGFRYSVQFSEIGSVNWLLSLENVWS